MKFFDKLHSSLDMENLILDKRQVSNICAALVFISMLVFSLGYFWGKRNAAEQFSNKVVNESFEDKISYSLFSLSNNSPEETVVVEEMPTESVKTEINEIAQIELPEIAESSIVKPEIKSESTKPAYYAELIGFSTKKTADEFLGKALDKGYPVKLKSRKSVTPKGKSVQWYQAVTETSDDKESLMKLVKNIEKTERLSGSKIVTI